MAKLWLATDAPGRFSMHGHFLFSGENPPSFEQGASQANDGCTFLGEVPVASVRGTLPEPGAFAEVLVVMIGGAS